MKSKITALSLFGLLSVSYASAENNVSHQSLVGDKNSAINLEQGDYVVNNCKNCCTDEKKLCDSVAEKLKVTSAQLPKSLLKRAQRLKEKNRNDDAKKILDWSIKNHSAFLEETLWLQGDYYENIGKTKESLMSYRKSVVLNEEKNPKYLMSAGKMARDYGEYEEAKKWLEKLLQVRLAEKKNDLNLAKARRELAVLYDDRGKKDDQDKAEKLYQEALEIYEKEYGVTSKYYAAVLHDMADYYRRKNDYLKAEPLFERCLDIIDKIYSNKNDPDIAHVLANFALLQKENRIFDKADQLFSRALRICDAASTLGTRANA